MGKRAFRLQGDGLKERMLGKRIEKLSQENVALKEQAKALKSEIEAERASEAQMLKALKGWGPRPPSQNNVHRRDYAGVARSDWPP